MRALVYGGRDWTDERRTFGALDMLHAKYGITMVVQGGARGADTLAGKWAASRAIHCARVDAMWAQHGRAAGPLRNAAMLSLQPQVAVEFPGGVGTANMREQLFAAGVPVFTMLPIDPYANSATTCRQTV